MFSVQIPGAFVLGTSSRYTCVQITRSINCSQYHNVQICNRHDSRAAQFDFNALHCATWKPWVRMIDRLTLGHDARSPQLCAKPHPLEHVLGTIAFRLRFGGALRGRYVPRTWFDRVPAGTVLAGTRLFRTHSDYKKWCVPRTCSRWNCTENKCERRTSLPGHHEKNSVPPWCVHAWITPHPLSGVWEHLWEKV